MKRISPHQRHCHCHHHLHRDVLLDQDGHVVVATTTTTTTTKAIRATVLLLLSTILILVLLHTPQHNLLLVDAFTFSNNNNNLQVRTIINNIFSQTKKEIHHHHHHQNVVLRHTSLFATVPNRKHNHETSNSNSNSNSNHEESNTSSPYNIDRNGYMAHAKSEESIPWWSSSSPYSCGDTTASYSSSPPPSSSSSSSSLSQHPSNGHSMNGYNGYNGRSTKIAANNDKSSKSNGGGVRGGGGIRGINTMMMNVNNAYDYEDYDNYNYDQSQFKELNNMNTNNNEERVQKQPPSIPVPTTVSSTVPLSPHGSNSNFNQQTYQSTRLESTRTSTSSTISSSSSSSSTTSASSMNEIQYNAEQKVEVMVEKQVELEVEMAVEKAINAQYIASTQNQNDGVNSSNGVVGGANIVYGYDHSQENHNINTNGQDEEVPVLPTPLLPQRHDTPIIKTPPSLSSSSSSSSKTIMSQHELLRTEKSTDKNSNVLNTKNMNILSSQVKPDVNSIIPTPQMTEQDLLINEYTKSLKRMTTKKQYPKKIHPPSFPDSFEHGGGGGGGSSSSSSSNDKSDDYASIYGGINLGILGGGYDLSKKRVNVVSDNNIEQSSKSITMTSSTTVSSAAGTSSGSSSSGDEIQQNASTEDSHSNEDTSTSESASGRRDQKESRLERDMKERRLEREMEYKVEHHVQKQVEEEVEAKVEIGSQGPVITIVENVAETNMEKKGGEGVKEEEEGNNLKDEDAGSIVQGTTSTNVTVINVDAENNDEVGSDVVSSPQIAPEKVTTPVKEEIQLIQKEEKKELSEEDLYADVVKTNVSPLQLKLEKEVIDSITTMKIAVDHSSSNSIDNNKNNKIANRMSSNTMNSFGGSSGNNGNGDGGIASIPASSNLSIKSVGLSGATAFVAKSRNATMASSTLAEKEGAATSFNNGDSEDDDTDYDDADVVPKARNVPPVATTSTTSKMPSTEQLYSFDRKEKSNTNRINLVNPLDGISPIRRTGVVNSRKSQGNDKVVQSASTAKPMDAFDRKEKNNINRINSVNPVDGISPIRRTGVVDARESQGNSKVVQSASTAKPMELNSQVHRMVVPSNKNSASSLSWNKSKLQIDPETIKWNSSSNIDDGLNAVRQREDLGQIHRKVVPTDSGSATINKSKIEMSPSSAQWDDKTGSKVTTTAAKEAKDHLQTFNGLDGISKVERKVHLPSSSTTKKNEVDNSKVQINPETVKFETNDTVYKDRPIIDTADLLKSAQGEIKKKGNSNNPTVVVDTLKDEGRPVQVDDNEASVTMRKAFESPIQMKQNAVAFKSRTNVRTTQPRIQTRTPVKGVEWDTNGRQSGNAMRLVEPVKGPVTRKRRAFEAKRPTPTKDAETATRMTEKNEGADQVKGMKWVASSQNAELTPTTRMENDQFLAKEMDASEADRVKGANWNTSTRQNPAVSLGQNKRITSQGGNAGEVAESNESDISKGMEWNGISQDQLMYGPDTYSTENSASQEQQVKDKKKFVSSTIPSKDPTKLATDVNRLEVKNPLDGISKIERETASTGSMNGQRQRVIRDKNFATMDRDAHPESNTDFSKTRRVEPPTVYESSNGGKDQERRALVEQDTTAKKASSAIETRKNILKKYLKTVSRSEEIVQAKYQQMGKEFVLEKVVSTKPTISTSSTKGLNKDILTKVSINSRNQEKVKASGPKSIETRANKDVVGSTNKLNGYDEKTRVKVPELDIEERRKAVPPKSNSSIQRGKSDGNNFVMRTVEEAINIERNKSKIPTSDDSSDALEVMSDLGGNQEELDLQDEALRTIEKDEKLSQNSSLKQNVDSSRAKVVNTNNRETLENIPFFATEINTPKREKAFKKEEVNEINTAKEQKTSANAKLQSNEERVAKVIGNLKSFLSGIKSEVKVEAETQQTSKGKEEPVKTIDKLKGVISTPVATVKKSSEPNVKRDGGINIGDSNNLDASKLCQEMALDADKKIADFMRGKAEAAEVVAALQQKAKAETVSQPSQKSNLVGNKMNEPSSAIPSKESQEETAVLKEVLSELESAVEVCSVIRDKSKQIKDYAEQTNEPDLMLDSVLKEYESAMKLCDEIEVEEKHLKSQIEKEKNTSDNADDLAKNVLSEYESALQLCNDLEVKNTAKKVPNGSKVESKVGDNDVMLESVLSEYESAIKEIDGMKATDRPGRSGRSFGIQKNPIEESALKLMQEMGLAKGRNDGKQSGSSVVINKDTQTKRRSENNEISVATQKPKTLSPLPLSALKIDSVIEGFVSSITHFGAFIKINYDLKGDGKQGFALLHSSQIPDELGKKGSKMFKNGDFVEGLRVIDIDRKKGKVGVSLLSDKRRGKTEMSEIPIGRTISGVVSNVVSYGAFIEIGADIKPLVHISKISRHDKVENAMDYLKKGDKVKIKVISKNSSKKTMEASMLDEDSSDHLERLISRRDNESNHPWARDSFQEQDDFEIANVASNDFEFLTDDDTEETDRAMSIKRIEDGVHQFVSEKSKKSSSVKSMVEKDSDESQKISTVIARKLNEFIQQQHEKFVMKSDTSKQQNI